MDTGIDKSRLRLSFTIPNKNTSCEGDFQPACSLVLIRRAGTLSGAFPCGPPLHNRRGLTLSIMSPNGGIPQASNTTELNFEIPRG